MSNPTTYAGTTVGICTTIQNADLTKTAAAALTYVDIDNVGQLGQYGFKTNMVSYKVFSRLMDL